MTKIADKRPPRRRAHVKISVICGTHKSHEFAPQQQKQQQQTHKVPINRLNLHRLVRFLYIIRYPHSRHRIASFGRISFSQWHSVEMK